MHSGFPVIHPEILPLSVKVFSGSQADFQTHVLPDADLIFLLSDSPVLLSLF